MDNEEIVFTLSIIHLVNDSPFAVTKQQPQEKRRARDCRQRCWKSNRRLSGRLRSSISKMPIRKFAEILLENGDDAFERAVNLQQKIVIGGK